MKLDPAARLEVVEALAEKLWEVADGASKHAAEDEVEFVVEIPFFFEVVDLEVEVGRDTVRMLVTIVNKEVNRSMASKTCWATHKPG